MTAPGITQPLPVMATQAPGVGTMWAICICTWSRYGDNSSSRYSDTASRYTSRYDTTSRYTSSYDSGRESPASPYSVGRSVTSPTLGRSSSSSYSTRLPTYYSRWDRREQLEEEEDEGDEERRRGRRVEGGDGEDEVARVQGNKGQVVLNEGTIVIRRQGAAVNTSDEEESEAEEVNEEEAVEEIEPEPARDPLDVEEEALQEKLQTAGFLLSMPEEEHIRKRLLEIKQMRENPELFRPENTKNYKFTQVSSEVAKASTAKEEEEKILLLRLNCRGVTDVEQTDLQVRLQEIWRDRREELSVGLGRVEQHYEHLLNESSTEISELESSIELKYQAISKMQEEMMILQMRKERLSADIDQVNTAHQAKLEELKAEISEVDRKSSENCVVRSRGEKSAEESLHCLPEDERSEVEADLECPVCYELSRPPIYQCPEGHIICSACKPLLKACPQCDTKYTDPPIRCRFAEKLSAKYFTKE